MHKLLIFMITSGISISAFSGTSNFDEKIFKTPVREYSIIATKSGFYPNKLMGFVGDKIRFFITSTADKEQCFLLQKHNVFLAAQKGKVSEGEINLTIPGRFKFYCPANKHTGYLTVFAKAEKEEEVKREVASEKPNYWTPRDYD